MSHPFGPQDPEQAGGTQSGQGAAAGHGQTHPNPQGYPAAPGYPGGAWYAGAPGYGGEPPMPPRRSRKRGLIVTGVAALAGGAALGGLIGSMNHGVAGTVTATSKTALSSSAIASRVDPALVDVVSTDGDQGATSAGTGIVLSSNGLILTNNHVINGATAIKVTDIGNGKTYTATVVGYDASHDVAVIQLQNASGLTTANLGNSSTVQVGDNVTALGNAEGKGGTPSVAPGTVTALNQSITASDELSSVSEQLTGLIETNAPIQPGDSGGPLVNAYGQVIGMDTAAGSSDQSSTTTQAYAIPINNALSIARQIESGTTSADVHIGATAFLGLEIGSSSSSSNSGSNGGSNGFGGFGGSNGFGGFGGSGDFGGFGGSIGSGDFGGSTGSGDLGGLGGSNSQSSTNGVNVAGTLSGSPAANAGITQGDTITAIGGQSISSAEDISHDLVKYHPGNSISISWVDASGQSHTANVTLASGPAA